MSEKPSSSRTLNVLVVDDDPIMRELASTKLADEGYVVDVAETGDDAWAMLQKRPRDLVVADIDMPGMDGFALTEAIRSRDALRETPVIVITSSDHGDAVDRAFAAGATSFVAKPINWALFAHSVRFVLRSSDDRRALRVARDQAQAGAHFKDALMSMMSHELRTPLNAIIGFGQILGDVFEENADAVNRQYADYIIDGGKRLLSSVSDILLVSDASSGVLTLNEGRCPVGDVIDLARQEIEQTIVASGAQIKVSMGAPGAEVQCDCALMGKALAKLISNSIKFSDRGVRVTVGSTLLKSGALALVVKDDGPGIDAQTRAAVMQPFLQSDMSLKRSKEGLGLGLPIVMAVSKAHDAVFKLESKPGEGAQAAIVFPKDRVFAPALRGAA
ncbi:MAG: hybrid sensor histidine kinase/response regulator [Pseudomonadota bacterium]